MLGSLYIYIHAYDIPHTGGSLTNVRFSLEIDFECPSLSLSDPHTQRNSLRETGRCNEGEE